MLLLFSSAPASGSIFGALAEAADQAAISAQAAIQASLAGVETGDAIILRATGSDIVAVIDPNFLVVARPRCRTILPKRVSYV
jgi:hypothetical protein